MLYEDPKFIRAVGTMVGSVVGVGVFGLPFALSASGPALGALIIAGLAVLVTAMQLMYAEVALHTAGPHRLVGYVREYLGEGWSRFTLAAMSASLWGAMIAYMIVGGKFLHALASPVFGGSEVIYALVMAAVAGAFMLRGIQFVSRIGTVIVCVLIFLFIFIVLVALPHAETANLAGVHWDNWLIPYGVALFALSGMGVIPEIKAVLGSKMEKHLPCVVVTAMSAIAALYLAFGITVVAVLGPQTTQAAFDGLVPVLGPAFGIIGALLGTVTVLSIFTIVGIELTNTFRYDFHIRPNVATAMAVGVPAVLYVAGIRELIDILMFVGSVFGGSLGILVVIMYEKMRSSPVRIRHACINVPRAASVGVIAVFAVGMALTIFNLFS